jgi:putative phosphoribosyl transferase
MSIMDRYRNRQEAGKILARELVGFVDREDVLVLGLPRGGVPVAFEIAKALHAPLDVFIVRKLGVPGHSELAMGAIATNNVKVFNEDIIRELSISDEAIEEVIYKEEQELKRRELSYRGGHSLPPIKDKIIILVDDGIATGASMRASIAALRQLDPKSIIVAVPVADKSMCEKLEGLVDKLVCPLRPIHFYAVGAWYEDFSQTEDEEVYTLLNLARLLSAEGQESDG